MTLIKAFKLIGMTGFLIFLSYLERTLLFYHGENPTNVSLMLVSTTAATSVLLYVHILAAFTDFLTTKKEPNS